ncbi:hypothetical protein RFA54_001602 [Vibrio vulnificus]|nr:hypothetical protein [Vibrio vulnificus]
MKKVTVKAIKPFYWGQFANLMKKPSSEPFEVTEHEYKQLAARKMVVLVEDAASEVESPQPAQKADPAPEPVEPEPEKPKTTRSKTSK